MKISLLKNEIFIGIDITDIKLFFESLDKKSKGYLVVKSKFNF